MMDTWRGIVKDLRGGNGGAVKGRGGVVVEGGHGVKTDAEVKNEKVMREVVGGGGWGEMS